MTALAATASVCAAACHGATPVQTAMVTRRSLVVPILADGTLEPPPGGEIRASEPGIVGQILVREGQHVVRGETLIRLDNPDLNQRVLAGRADAAQLREEQQRSGMELEAAKRERNRLHSIAAADARLVRSGAITAEQQATDESRYEQSAEKLRQVELHFGEIAKHLRIVEDATQNLERRLALLVIRAPADGVVYNLPRTTGENILPGQLIAVVADPQHVRVRARIESPDLPHIRVGQTLIVTFDGLPKQRWIGSVTLVPPGLRQAGSREVAEVLGEVSGDAAGLPANASVNVEIHVGEKASALVIPRSALFRYGQMRFVYRLVDGKAQRANVSLGLMGPNEVEITSGLSEGDRVILPGTAPLHEGDAVNPS